MCCDIGYKATHLFLHSTKDWMHALCKHIAGLRSSVSPVVPALPAQALGLSSRLMLHSLLLLQNPDCRHKHTSS